MDGIPVADMNTSMTINATAAWLLGLYVAHAEDAGADLRRLAGTTQNDIIKEYLSRGTYIFPPEPSRRLIVDTIAWTAAHTPRWNPVNVCSYHLQEAGATPVQELAYALATAIGVLDAVRSSGQVTAVGLPDGRRAGVVLRQRRHPFCRGDLQGPGLHPAVGPHLPGALWRRGPEPAPLPLRGPGQQPRPHRGPAGKQRAPHRARAARRHPFPRARARAIQLPAWNEALGLPRPWDQQWSLRIQQVLAYETDLLEYDDIFDGSKVIEARTA